MFQASKDFIELKVNILLKSFTKLAKKNDTCPDLWNCDCFTIFVPNKSMFIKHILYKSWQMKILHLIYSFFIGGAESLLIDIANGQARLGHDVTVMIVNDGIDEALVAKFVPDVKVERMNRRQGDKPLLMMARLNWFIFKMKPDIIHAHHHKFCRLVQVRKSHLLLTVHDINTAMIYAARSNMVAITEAVKTDVLQRVPTARITTILNGIDTTAVVHRAPVDSQGNFRLVQVANLLPHKKGQDLAIRALGELHRRGVDDVDITFIGGGDASELKRMAQEEGVAERVHFAGLRDRRYVYQHLADFDAMCHPSRYEGFGLTVAEGMAAGLPLILTRHDGPWEVADNGRLCTDFEKDNVVSLAEAILKVKDNYVDAQRLAKEGLDYVKRYDISRTVNYYENFYRSLLADK